MKNKKKLRVFEAFAGIGAQAAALKRLNIDYEIVGISDWFIDAIECYSVIHCENKEVEVPKTKGEVLDYLSKFTFSADSVHPYNISRLSEDRLRDLYRANKKCNNYHDIVETELITLDEYVSSTNISVNEVKKRLETAKLIAEFLEFMGVPKQYHIAREMQVWTVFYETVGMMKKCGTEEQKEELKRTVFSNTMLGSFADQKKFVRNLNSMMETGMYSAYMKRQAKLTEALEEKKQEQPITNQKELYKFIKDNEELAEDLQISMERSVLQSKKAEIKNRPSQIVNKSLSMLMDIDTRIFDKLSETEKDKLQTQLHRLNDAVSMISEEVNDETEEKSEKEEQKEKRLFLTESKQDEPFVFVKEITAVTNLNFALYFSALKYRDTQKEQASVIVYFANEEYEELSALQEVNVKVGELTKVNFSLNSSASGLKKCYLIIKSSDAKFGEAQQAVGFDINVAFKAEFGF